MNITYFLHSFHAHDPLLFCTHITITYDAKKEYLPIKSIIFCAHIFGLQARKSSFGTSEARE